MAQEVLINSIAIYRGKYIRIIFVMQMFDVYVVSALVYWCRVMLDARRRFADFRFS